MLSAIKDWLSREWFFLLGLFAVSIAFGAIVQLIPNFVAAVVMGVFFIACLIMMTVLHD